MVSWGTRVRAICATAIVVGVVALPNSAQAQTPAPSAAPASAPVGVKALPKGILLNNLQSALSNLTGTAQSLLCPITSALPLLPILTCNLDLLGFKWHTEFKRANGTIVKRDIGGILELPQLLDVDDDPLPDISARIGLRSLSPISFDVYIDRGIGENSQLPVSVEAIIADPTKGSLPRKYINFGYDTKESHAPTHWETNIAVRTVTGGTGIDVKNKQTGQGNEPTTMVAGLFNGTAGNRVDEAGGRLRYNPAPASSGLSFNIGKSYAIGLTTSIPTVLDADAFFNTGTDRIAGALHIDKLQTNTEVTFTPQGTDQRQITYEASGKVDQMVGSYRHFTQVGNTQTPLETFRAKVTDVPTKIVVNQTSKSAVNMSTQGTGPIGSIEAGFANGEPVFLPAVQHHYVNIFSDGTLKSFAGRIDGLTEASFDAQSKITAEAQLASKPLLAKIDQPDLKVDGLLTNVPAHLKATIDLPNGTVDYDGFGSTIDTIDVKASRTTPFFGRATNIDALIKAIPPVLSLAFKPDGTSAKFTAAPNGIGSIEVAAYKAGDKELPPGTEAGAVYRDVPNGKYALGARILGLKSVQFTGGATYTVKTDLQAGPFNLAYEDGTQQLDGRIQDLPSTIDLSLNLPDGKATYTASSAIGKITVDAKRPGSPFFQRATRVRGTIEGLPASLALDFKPDLSEAKFAASSPITKIELAATDGDTQTVPGTDAGVIYRDIPSDYVAAGRILGLQGVSFKGGSKFEVGAQVQSGPFSLTFENADVKLDGAIKNIPSDISFKMDQAAGTYQYAGNASIGEISLDLVAANPFLASIRKARAVIKGIPSSMLITAKPDNNGIKATATGGIGSIDVAVASDTIEPVAGTGAGVRATYLPGVLRGALRINGLSSVEYVPDPLKVSVGATAGQAFSIDAEAQFGSMPVPMTVTGGIHDIPSSVTVDRDTSGGQDNINYNAHDPIGSIDLHAANLPGGFVNFADVVVTGVPKSFQLKLPANNKFAFDTFGQGVTSIQAEASKDGSHFGGLPGGNVARYEAVGDDQHAFARITHLNKVDVDLGSTKQVHVNFSQAPDPLTADLKLQPTGGSNTRLHAHMSQPPQDVLVEIQPGADAKIHYHGQTKIPSINVEAEIGDSAVIRGTLTNIPTDITVCVGGGQQCDEGHWYDYLQSFGFILHTNAPSNDPVNIADALVCLTVNSGAMDVPNCSANGKKYIRIQNLEFNDVDFEFGSGTLSNGDESNIPIYLDTGTHGITVDFLVYKDPDFAVGNGIFLKKQGTGIGAHNMGLLIDTTVIPTIDDSMGSFDCSGSGTFEAGIVDSTSGQPGGALSVSYTDLSGLLDFFIC
jgi:hypothetical protein